MLAGGADVVAADRGGSGGAFPRWRAPVMEAWSSGPGGAVPVVGLFGPDRADSSAAGSRTMLDEGATAEDDEEDPLRGGVDDEAGEEHVKLRRGEADSQQWSWR